MPSPDEWAQARLRVTPGTPPVPAAALRGDYLAWHSDFGPAAGRPAPAARVNKALVQFGAGRRMVGPDGTRGLHFADVSVRPWPPTARRDTVASPVSSPAPKVLTALSALHSAGLVTDTRALDQAYLRLTGSRGGRLCAKCGQVTRWPRRHRGCQ